jgi:hypothetical protein
MVFLLSEYHARKVPDTESAGKLARIIHPFNAANTTHSCCVAAK